jgi:predicted SAM-dependent methyltransferase
MLRVNVGCGLTPTAGWKNFDNSPSLRLSKIRLLPEVLKKLGLIGKAQLEFIQFTRKNAIEYGDASRGLPVAEGSVDILYTSHMLEHLDKVEADHFLTKALHILRPGGTLRIAVPDLAKHIAFYMESGDGNGFLDRMFVCMPRPRSLSARLAMALFGTRHHQWMYDGESLTRLLNKHGFVDIRVLESGQTGISDPGNLDLTERSYESLYVEAKRAEI